MVKKTLLVNGPSQDPSDRFFGWPTPLLYAVAPSIAAARSGELNVRFVEQMFDPIWYVEGKNNQEIKNSFQSLLEKEDVNVLCASAIYDSLYPTLQLFKTAKQLNPHIVTILGGPHFDEIHTLEEFNDISLRPNLVDIGIAGDGEYALKATLEALVNNISLSSMPWNTIEGKADIYTNKGEHYKTSGNLLNLNALPFIPLEFADIGRHQYDFDIFKGEQGKQLSAAQMIASRGCPYTCTFCSENRNLAYPNARSINNILKEIELRKNQGFKAIFFDDSTFGAHPQLQPLLKALKTTSMQFGCLNRFNHLINPKLIQLYKDAGFTYFYCSIEQFDDATLRKMKKGQTSEKIGTSMRLLHDAGFKLGVSLLYGLPYETPYSIERTLDFTQEWVEKGTIKLVSESVLSYHPGTPEGVGNVTEGFQRTPPNQGYPFNRFEEGQWYHPPHVTIKYLEKILEASERRFKNYLVRNRHSWYAHQGLTLKEH